MLALRCAAGRQGYVTRKLETLSEEICNSHRVWTGSTQRAEQPPAAGGRPFLLMGSLLCMPAAHYEAGAIAGVCLHTRWIRSGPCLGV
jgi:hypothetical protein